MSTKTRNLPACRQGRKHKTFLSLSSSQTEKLGRELAGKVFKFPSNKGAVVVGLIGDLGGGKTTFIKGFAKGLGVKEKILSPTFVVMRRFEIDDLRFKNFYHFDCYRIKNPKEILELNFKEIISYPKNIVCLEWADRIKKNVPKETVLIRFEFIDKKTRKISFKF